MWFTLGMVTGSNNKKNINKRICWTSPFTGIPDRSTFQFFSVLSRNIFGHNLSRKSVFTENLLLKEVFCQNEGGFVLLINNSTLRVSWVISCTGKMNS